MTKHVVAGAAGFLGSHLVDRLLAKGDEVLGIDSLITGRLENLGQALGNPRFTFAKHDVTTPFFVAGKMDAVWNFASPASPVDYLKNPVHTMKVGSLGCLHLLGLAKRHKARFLLASTSEVYGDPEVSPQPEEYWGRVNPVGPRSVYDEAKRFAEALTTSYRREHGVDTRIVRIFNTYGPRMRLDDGRVVPNFIGQAMRGEPLTLYGSGKQTRSFCYVDDLLEGIERLMASAHPGPMNIGNPREITIEDFANVLEKIIGRPLQRIHKPLPQDDPTQRCPDITKARGLLAWEPQVGLEDGLRRTVTILGGTGAAASSASGARRHYVV